MKRPQFPSRKLDVLGLQTMLEIAAGAVFSVMLLRWIM
jgi:hypothetical protein